MIGCVPAFEIFSANSSAPHKLVVSHKPKDLILLVFAMSFNSSILIAPSQIEYCECTFKLLKLLFKD